MISNKKRPLKKSKAARRVAAAAAELAAAAKLKAEQLRARIRGWRHLWLKDLCADLLPDDKDPRRARLDFRQVDDLAAELGVDLADAWSADLKCGGARLQAFLELHTVDELDTLNQTEEWGIYLEGAAKALKVARLKACIKPDRLPKSVAPVAARGKRKRGR